MVPKTPLWEIAINREPKTASLATEIFLATPTLTPMADPEADPVGANRKPDYGAKR